MRTWILCLFIFFQGHKRHALKDRDYPGVVPTGKDSDQVLGMLCEGLTAQDVKRLDAFEGDVRPFLRLYF